MALTSVSQQSTAGSTASTVTLPSGIQAGDVLFLADKAVNSSGLPTAVTPSGWTHIAESSDANRRRLRISYKIATGSESSTSITGMDGTSSVIKSVVTFRPNEAATLVSPSTFNMEHTTGNPTPQTVSAAGQVSPLVVLGIYGTNNSAIDPRTFTVGGSAAKDGETSQDTELYVAWKVYNSSPADVVVDMDDEGENTLLSGFLTLRGTVAGASSFTEAVDTLSATATVAIAATAAYTAGGDTVSATGTVDVVATASPVEDEDTLSATGVVGVAELFGEAAFTEDDDTLSSAYAVNTSATGDYVEDADSLSATGTVYIAGTAAVTEGDDIPNATGTVDVVAQASVTEADDTTAATGTVAVFAVATCTEDDDASSAVYTVTALATLAAAEDDDALAGACIVAVTVFSSATEADDTLAATLAVVVAGAAATAEADDTLSAAMLFIISAVVNASEADDTLASDAVQTIFVIRAQNVLGNIVTTSPTWVNITQAAPTLTQVTQ